MANMEHSTGDMKQALENWQQGRSTLDEIRTMASDLGNQHFAPGIPVLIQLLDYDDEIVRYNAVNSLAFEFHHQPVVAKLQTMLTKESDEDNRRIAAAALGTLCLNSKNRSILKALANAALNDLDDDVRRSAYEALITVNGVSREEHLRLLTGGSLPVDQARVQTILTEISG